MLVFTLKHPFGGYKQSGIGRDLGMHALDGYSEIKTSSSLRIDLMSMNQKTLKQLIERGEIHTVVAAFPDGFSGACGQALHRRFLSQPGGGPRYSMPVIIF